MSNKNLVGIFRKLDFTVIERENSRWNDLRKYNTKNNVIILSWMRNGYIGHFSVLQKASLTHVYIADPVLGRTTRIPRAKFMRLWLDYNDKWYPIKRNDITLRWMAIVSNTSGRRKLI